MVIEFGQLNKVQREVIEGYSTGAFQAINPYLRNDIKFDFLGDIAWNVEIMDSIFNLSPKRPNPLILYRGTKNNDTFKSAVFTEKAYMSTSIREDIARKKEFLHPENGILLKIHLQCSNIKLLGIDGKIEESEYLIPRNTSFKVLYRGEEM
ncbi:MAG TPA: ADP-ribosyltransferase, partial [Bacteroidia bacterium]|nr:ADP-ribosyltransferase [Bacteroidia bacterium]